MVGDYLFKSIVIPLASYHLPGFGRSLCWDVVSPRAGDTLGGAELSSWVWQGLGVSVQGTDNKRVLESADFPQCCVIVLQKCLPMALSCGELTVWVLGHSMERLLGSTGSTSNRLGVSSVYVGAAIQLLYCVAFSCHRSLMP